MTKKQIENMQNVLNALKQGEIIFFRKKGSNNYFDIFYGEDLNFVKYEFKAQADLKACKEEQSVFKIGSLLIFKDDLKNLKICHPAIYKIVGFDDEFNQVAKIELRQTNLNPKADIELKLNINVIDEVFLSIEDERLFYRFEVLENNELSTFVFHKRTNFKGIENFVKTNNYLAYNPLFMSGVYFKESG